MFQIVRKKGYWLCQGIGWGLYFLFGVVMTAIFSPEFSPIAIYDQAIITLVLLMLSHFHRQWIKRKKILAKPKWKMTGHLLISNFILAVISQIILTPILVLLMNQTQDYHWLQSIGYFGYAYMISMIWTTMYVGIKSVQKRHQAEIEQWKLEAQLKKEELHRLREQINPHFMFNALNNIRSLVEEDAEKSRTAITKLSSLLRASLQYESQQLIPLELEVQLVKDYLDLEKIQLEERLQVQWFVDADLQQIQIPAMSLQVLVENAIKHGVSNNPQGGMIEITISKENAFTQIRVRNPGKLASHFCSGNGLGLENSRQRLKKLMGETASLVLFKKKGTVIAEMKWKTSSEQKIKTATL